MTISLSDKTALLIGLGGLGCPAALALAQAGVGCLILVDDDVVTLENLHRQILYRDTDIGRHKLDAAADALCGRTRVVAKKTRFLPENAIELASGADIILEGADNFATKFLASDAALLAGLPIVHGAAIRWHGTALLARPGGRPCYRCVFEDLLPDDQAPACNTAGVIGPVVGLVGALMADLALDALNLNWSRAGVVMSVDGLAQKFRESRFSLRTSCDCSSESRGPKTLSRERYISAPCAP